MNRPSGSTATVTTLVSSALANHDGLAEGLETRTETPILPKPSFS